MPKPLPLMGSVWPPPRDEHTSFPFLPTCSESKWMTVVCITLLRYFLPTQAANNEASSKWCITTWLLCAIGSTCLECRHIKQDPPGWFLGNEYYYVTAAIKDSEDKIEGSYALILLAYEWDKNTCNKWNDKQNKHCIGKTGSIQVWWAGGMASQPSMLGHQFVMQTDLGPNAPERLSDKRAERQFHQRPWKVFVCWSRRYWMRLFNSLTH